MGLDLETMPTASWREDLPRVRYSVHPSVGLQENHRMTLSDTVTAFEALNKPLWGTMALSSIVLRHRSAYWASAGFSAGSLDSKPSSFLLRKVRYVVGPRRPAVRKMLVGSVIEWWEDVIAWVRQRCSLVVGWSKDSKDARDPCIAVDYDCRSAYCRLRSVTIGRVFAPFCTDVQGPCRCMDPFAFFAEFVQVVCSWKD